jgi:hypothetical protein
MKYFTKNLLSYLNRQRSSINPINESIKLRRYGSLASNKFDIFLSHSTLDKTEIFGLYKMLTYQLGLNVYVDWLVDPELDRRNVTVETVRKIKTRMGQSEIFIFASSENSTNSYWATWEVGFFDALKGKVSILPILEYDDQNFRENEYLLLYPKISFQDIVTNLIVKDDSNFYRFAAHPKRLTAWINE